MSTLHVLHCIYLQVSKFVEYLTEGQPTAPSYFSHDVQTNMVSMHYVLMYSGYN